MPRNAIELYHRLEELRNRVTLCLVEVEDVDFTSKALMQRYLNKPEELGPPQAIKIQALCDYMTELINVGNWKEVKPFLRKTITITSYIRLLCHIKCAETLFEDVLKEAYRIIDRGILFGCPLMKEPQLLQNCAKILAAFEERPRVESAASRLPENKANIDPTKYRASLIDTVDCPSMEYFFKNHILAKTPLVLDNCINHWPALSKWKDQEYLKHLAGCRTVPVEIGKNYTDSEWTQKIMTIEEFIQNHIYKNDGQTGYLAQYHLFEHIPELKDDITVPDYCCFSETNTAPDIMAWYGPKGTLTPLHYDSKHNLLAQVVGQKLVFLFSPLDSEYLYQYGDELLHNTAKVDPRAPDLEKYPKYKDAKPYYCILNPGQLLYIPFQWWHFVESLSLSFSVSFWWQ